MKPQTSIFNPQTIFKLQLSIPEIASPLGLRPGEVWRGVWGLKLYWSLSVEV